MAALVGCHDMGTRFAQAALFEEVYERLFDNRLKLAPLLLGNTPHGGQRLRVYLGGEFFAATGGHDAIPECISFMIYHDKSRKQSRIRQRFLHSLHSP